MNIGVVTTSYPREPGDPAGSFVGAHVRWLRRAGHRVDVIAAGDGDQPIAVSSASGDTHRVPSRLFYRGGAPDRLETGGPLALASAFGFSLRQLGAIARRVKQWNAVCAHWLAPSALAVSTALWARRVQLPFLGVAHSGDVHWLERLRLTATAARLLDRGDARLAFSSGPLAARFFAGAGAAAESLRERALVCAMGVELPDAHPPQSPHRGHRCRLLYVGRLVAIKGIDVLLRATAQLGDRVELAIAGAGPARAELEELAAALGIAERARFLGEVRAPFRDHLFAAADIVVVPSRALESGRTEGMPVVVLEAIAAGAPVIVSRTGGLEELPDSVPKVAPGSASALAAAIAQLRSPRARAICRERQRPIAEAQRWERVGARLWRHWVGADLATGTRRTA